MLRRFRLMTTTPASRPAVSACSATGKRPSPPCWRRGWGSTRPRISARGRGRHHHGGDAGRHRQLAGRRREGRSSGHRGRRARPPRRRAPGGATTPPAPRRRAGSSRPGCSRSTRGLTSQLPVENSSYQPVWEGGPGAAGRSRGSVVEPRPASAGARARPGRGASRSSAPGGARPPTTRDPVESEVPDPHRAHRLGLGPGGGRRAHRRAVSTWRRGSPAPPSSCRATPPGESRPRCRPGRPASSSPWPAGPSGHPRADPGRLQRHRRRRAVGGRAGRRLRPGRAREGPRRAPAVRGGDPPRRPDGGGGGGGPRRVERGQHQRGRRPVLGRGRRTPPRGERVARPWCCPGSPGGRSSRGVRRPKPASRIGSASIGGQPLAVGSPEQIAAAIDAINGALAPQGIRISAPVVTAGADGGRVDPLRIELRDPPLNRAVAGAAYSPLAPTVNRRRTPWSRPADLTPGSRRRSWGPTWGCPCCWGTAGWASRSAGPWPA